MFKRILIALLASRYQKKLDMARAWREKNKAHISEYNAKDHAERSNDEQFKENAKAKSAAWRANATEEAEEKIKESKAKYREANREALRAKGREYSKKHIKRKCAYMRERSRSDLDFRLRGIFRHRLWGALSSKGASKIAHTVELIGCSLEQLKAYLESLFISGMSWENYGDWHIDHKKPCASFDLTDPEQQRACFHYSNLQPLWAKDNLSKGAKLFSADK